jgi:hypothetical protein
MAGASIADLVREYGVAASDVEIWIRHAMGLDRASSATRLIIAPSRRRR